MRIKTSFRLSTGVQTKVCANQIKLLEEAGCVQSEDSASETPERKIPSR